MTLVLSLHEADVGDLSAVWARLHAQPAEAMRALTRIHHADETRSWSTDELIARRLLATWPAQFQPIVAWAVANPSDALAEEVWMSVHPFAIRALGEVGELADVELLQPYLLDPDVGSATVDAIRRIHDRYGA
jgi:hypothetical protein